MDRTNALIRFHELLTERLAALEKEHAFPRAFYQDFLSGKRTLRQKDITETKAFKGDWIDTLESYIPSIDRIIRNAKTTLRYDREVTDIERAKKVGSEAVRHLAQNAHMIRDIEGDRVIPKRILTSQAEIEIATYENRFIKTLLYRLIDFLNDRQRIIKNNVDTLLKREFDMESEFGVDGTKIDLEIRLKTEQLNKSDEQSVDNHELLERTNELLSMLGSLKKTTFIKELEDTKPVKPPIIKTQILQKNVDYRNGYLLWLFLDRHGELDYDVKIAEKNLTFDQKYLKSIYQSALVTFANIVANQVNLEFLYKYLDVREYKQKAPKVITQRALASEIDPKRIEDSRINQYYLEQTKTYFEGILKEHEESSSTYEVALRRALRDTIAISNALYQSFFEFKTELDKDIFAHLVKLEPEEELQEARHQACIARIIRETKEVDYKEAIRREKRLLKRIEKLDRAVIRENKKKIKEQAKEKEEENRLRLEEMNAKTNLTVLDEHNAFVKEQNEAIRRDHQSVSEKIAQEKMRLKEIEKRELAKAKERARIAYQKEQRKVKQKLAKEKEALRKKKQAERKKERERLQRAKEREKVRARARIAREKERIARKNEQRIAKEKEKVNA
ncbi:MAG: DUF2357 domain-containing protein [Acholeplasmataceae bacterium]